MPSPKPNPNYSRPKLGLSTAQVMGFLLAPMICILKMGLTLVWPLICSQFFLMLLQSLAQLLQKCLYSTCAVLLLSVSASIENNICHRNKQSFSFVNLQTRIFRKLSTDYVQCFEVLWKLVLLWLHIIVWVTFHIFKKNIHEINIFKKDSFLFLILYKI